MMCIPKNTLPKSCESAEPETMFNELKFLEVLISHSICPVFGKGGILLVGLLLILQ